MEKIRGDSLALSVAGALVLANEAATDAGIDPKIALITISQEQLPAGNNWRIHYGPRDYIHRRGGDITVIVDELAGNVRKIMRGQ